MNIFLTGKHYVGKSFIIEKLLLELEPSLKFGGFRTKRIYKNKKLSGYGIEEYLLFNGVKKEDKEDQKTINTDVDANFNDYDIYESKELIHIGRCLKPGVWEGIPDAFDGFGVNILEKCTHQNLDIIIMDELGFFESNAFEFQSMVHHVLDLSVPVIGVIKDVNTTFLNSVRKRSDVSVLRVTESNRDFIASYIKKIFYNKIPDLENTSTQTIHVDNISLQASNKINLQ
jgi:nucleoside-triphosphatase